MSTKTAAKTPAFVLLTQADTKTLIGKIKTAGKKLDDMIQTALQCSAIHAHQHGDITLLQGVLEALPKGSRSVAVKDWMLKHAPLGFDEKGGMVFIRSYDVKDETTRQIAIELCIKAIHWTECKPEAPFVPFDLDKALAALLKKAKAAQDDSEHADKHKLDLEKLAKLQALV